MLSGEIIAVLEAIKFDSKKELLDILRTMRKNTIKLDKKDRHVVKAMLGVAIQQVYHNPEELLLEYCKKQHKGN